MTGGLEELDGNVALGVGFDVDEEGVEAAHCLVDVVVEGGVVH